jgi:hypothetical protein
MTQLDQFESIFRAAAKTVFEYEAVSVRKVLSVTDLETSAAQAFTERMVGYLAALGEPGSVQWETLDESAATTVGDLLDRVQTIEPDLICTYRNLHSSAWKWPHTLGDHLEVLTQATTTPVLVVPRPDETAFEAATSNTDRVMAITDHLTGDHRLVNFAARFTARPGRLYLTHVQDEATFEHYLDVISKIPQIDTLVARETILERLLREPADYIRSCRDALREAAPQVEVRKIVTVGRRLEHYRRLITEHEVDMLVLHTKDEDQMAMHGLAYPLAVELREKALLML